MSKKHRPSVAAASPKPVTARAQSYNFEIVVSLLLIVVNIIIYAQTAKFQLTNFDDPDYVTNNLYVKAGLTAKSIWWALTSFDVSNWHPLTWLSLMADVQFFGNDAGTMHVINLGFHILNSLLLFYVLRDLTKTQWQSAIVAMLFAVHPAHVESVAWIAERKDVLSTLFWLLTIWAYGYYCRQQTVKNYLLTAIALALGLMAKPMVVTLPFVLLLLDYWPLNRIKVDEQHRVGSLVSSAWPLIKEKLPLFGLIILSSIITFIAQKRGGAVKTFEDYPFSLRLANAFAAYGKYILMSCWPVKLSVYYPYSSKIPIWQVAGAIALLAAITIAVLVFAWRYRYLVTGWFWYLGTLVPVIGLVQVGAQSMADRYTYVPFIGLFIMVVWTVFDLTSSWPRQREVVGTTAAIISLALMIGAYHQTGYWQDSIRLFERVLSIMPQDAEGRENVSRAISLGYNNLGLALAEQGRQDEAIAQYQQALQFNDKFAPAYNNLGNALQQKRDSKEAITNYRRAIDLKPDYAEAHNNLASVYCINGRIDEGIDEFLKAIAVKPDYISAQFNLGNAYLLKKDFPAAKAQFEKVLQLDPQDQDARKRIAQIEAQK